MTEGDIGREVIATTSASITQAATRDTDARARKRDTLAMGVAGVAAAAPLAADASAAAGTTVLGTAILEAAVTPATAEAGSSTGSTGADGSSGAAGSKPGTTRRSAPTMVGPFDSW